jgi:hypothetical protein
MSDVSTLPSDGSLLSRSVSIPATVPALVDTTGCSTRLPSGGEAGHTRPSLAHPTMSQLGALALEMVMLEEAYSQSTKAVPLNGDRQQHMAELIDLWNRVTARRKELRDMAKTIRGK